MTSDLCTHLLCVTPQPPGPLTPPGRPRHLPCESKQPSPRRCFYSANPLPSPGRCSVFPDLSFVTFDGSHAALFKEAIYILSQSPDEMITVHVLDCKSANLVTAPCFPSCQHLEIGLFGGEIEQ